MRTERMVFGRPAAWLAALVVLASAGVCLAQQEPGNVPKDFWPEVPPSRYWVGLVSEPVPDSLRAQLKLPERQGLLVEQVAPNSPAAAAALEQYDILLKVNGKPLANVQDLIAAVEAANGKKIELDLLRQGKPMKVAVTPARRPPGGVAELLPPTGGERMDEAMRKWVEQFRPGVGPGPDYRFFFLRPGVVVGRPGVLPDLPPNVSVSITKQGKSPAKIIVTRDGQKWEASEGNLDKLPADLRPYVEAMLRRPLRGLFPPAIEGRLPPVPGTPPEPPGENRPQAQVSPPPSQSVQRQLETINRRLDELRKAVDALKQKQSHSPSPPETIPAPKPQPPK